MRSPNRLLFALLLVISLVMAMLPVQIGQFGTGTASASGWLTEGGNWTYREKVTLTNPDDEDRANATFTIRVSPYAFPIETGSWTTNSKTASWRLPFTITEAGNTSLIDFQVCFYLNTKYLIEYGYIASSDRIEIGNSTGGDNQYYWYENNTTYLPYSYYGNNTHDTEYWTKGNLTALEDKVLYIYGNNSWASASSYFSKSDVFTYSTYTIGQQSDDKRYWTFSYLGKVCSYSLSYAYNGAGDSGGVYLDNCGMRFTSISFNPTTDVLYDSYITLTADANRSTTIVNTNLYAQDADNAATFTTDDSPCSDFTGRTRTEVYTVWDSIPAWTLNSTYSTPALNNPLNKVFSRAGWSSGNAVVVFWQNNSSSTSANRTGYGYTTANSSNLPVLKIWKRTYAATDPVVSVPPLEPADVYLNNHFEHWPYDIAVTKSDGTTQLYYDIPIETIYSHYNGFIELNFKLDGVTIAGGNGTYDIYIYTGNAAQSAKSSYWDASQVYSYYSDASSTTGWTASAGTWATNTQQLPMYKNDEYLYSRNPNLIYYQENYYNIHIGAYSSLTPWGAPWYGSMAKSEAMNFWQYNHSVFRDDSAWAWAGNPNSTFGTGSGFYIENIWDNTAIDGKFYALYESITEIQNSDGHVSYGIATFSNPEEGWTKNANNPVFTWESVPEGLTFGATLVYDSVDGQWYIFFTTTTVADGWYVGYGNTTNINNDFTWGGVAFDNNGYIENFDIKWDTDNSCWVMVYSKGAAPQDMATATSTNLPSTWTDLGDLTLTQYNWNAYSYGAPRVFKVGSTWHMQYYGIPVVESPNGMYQYNFTAHATTGNLTSETWTAQDTTSMFYQSNTGAGNFTYYHSGNYTDVEVVGDVMGSYANSGYFAGLVVRWQDANNCIKVFFNSYSNSIETYKVISGVQTIIGNTTLSVDILDLWPGGHVHRIRVRDYGNDIEVAYSPFGETWITSCDVTVSDLPAYGKVGFIAATGSASFPSQAYFDNFQVKPYIEPDIYISATSGQYETPNISNAPTTVSYGVVQVSQTYWAKNGLTTPSFPLADGNCTEVVDNLGTSTLTAITVKATNFTGATTIIIVSGSPGADQVRLAVFESGDGIGDGQYVTTTAANFLTTVTAGSHRHWEMRLETGTSLAAGVYSGNLTLETDPAGDSEVVTITFTVNQAHRGGIGIGPSGFIY